MNRAIRILSILLLVILTPQLGVTLEPPPQKVRIIIDPAFGGKELGGQGSSSGIYSKDINLKLALILARQLTQTHDIDAVLTRDTDKSLSLEERVNFARKSEGAYLVSIQANANNSASARGIETFIPELPRATTQPGNPGPDRKMSNLATMLERTLESSRNRLSTKLAEAVHQTLSAHLQQQYSDIKDRGTTLAPFYVLTQAGIPAIAISPGFISNPAECKRLQDPNYLNDVAAGITQGVLKFIHSTRATSRIEAD